MAYNLLYYNTEAKAGQTEGASSSVYSFSGYTRIEKIGNPLEYDTRHSYLCNYTPNSLTGFSFTGTSESYDNGSWVFVGEYTQDDISSDVVPVDGAFIGYSGDGEDYSVVTFHSNGETGVTASTVFWDDMTACTLNYEKIYKDGTNESYYALIKSTEFHTDPSRNNEYQYADSVEFMFPSLSDLAAWENVIDTTYLYKVNLIQVTSAKATKITSVDPGVGYIAESGRVLYNNDPHKPSVTVKIQTSSWISPPIDNPNPSPIATKKFKNMAATCEELAALINQCDGNTNTYYVRVEDSAGTVIYNYQVSPNIDKQSQCNIIEQILTSSSPAFNLWDSATETFDSSLEGCTINIAQKHEDPLA